MKKMFFRLSAILCGLIVFIGRLHAQPCVPSTLSTHIAHPAPAYQDSFGSSVAISGNNLLIGISLDDISWYQNAGSIAMGTVMSSLVTVVNNPEPEAYDSFGLCVAISENLIVVSAPF